MRHLRLLALLVPALLLPAACEDSSSSSGGLVAPEGGPGLEAGSPDAAQPVADAAVDNFVPPLPKGITVTVTDAAMPKADVRVILHDATGAVTSETKTNALGKATAPAAPSMVTVLIAGGVGSVAPVTFMGVADGDNLIVAVPAAPIIEQAPFATYNVSFDFSDALIMNATSFGVFVGECYGSSTSARVAASVSLYSGCIHSPNATVTTATDVNNNAIGFSFVKNLAKPAAGSTVAVGPQTFTAPGATKVSATNLPAGPNAISFGRLISISNNVGFELGSSTGALTTGGLTYPTPTGFADAYQSGVIARTRGVGFVSEKTFVRREATTAPATANLAPFDFANALPFISNVALAKPTPARPDITITSDGSLSSADGGYVSLNWSVPANETSGTWMFVLPPATTAFKVPALPADASAFVPAANVDTGAAFFFDATQINGYKELKALPVSSQYGVDLADTNRLLPSAGTLRTARWFGGPQG